MRLWVARVVIACSLIVVIIVAGTSLGKGPSSSAIPNHQATLDHSSTSTTQISTTNSLTTSTVGFTAGTTTTIVSSYLLTTSEPPPTTGSTTSSSHSSSTVRSTVNSSSSSSATTASTSFIEDLFETYTVVGGDTLYKIGLRFNVPWQSIAQANSIQSPYMIYPGEVLVIPGSSSPSSSTLNGTSSAGNSTDPIATGNPFYDQYDAVILAAASEYGLDPMVLKSQIAQESFFNSQAVSPDDPCGPVYQNGVDVGHSYGLLQMTPACNPGFAHNPDGTIDLTPNTSSPQWKNSAFNPTYNILSSAQGESFDLVNAKQLFGGCTGDQYVYMSLSIYNAGVGSVSGCSLYNQMGSLYVQNILNWYAKLASMANLSDPYR